MLSFIFDIILDFILWFVLDVLLKIVCGNVGAFLLKLITFGKLDIDLEQGGAKALLACCIGFCAIAAFITAAALFTSTRI